jgi:hypothetical protein
MFANMFSCCRRPLVKEDLALEVNDSAMLLEPCLAGKKGGATKTASILV